MTSLELYHGKKIVGHVKDRIYHTTRTPETIFRKYNSVNISERIVNQLKRLEVKAIFVKYISSSGIETLYKTTFSKFLKKARTITIDGDVQYYFKLDYFKDSRDPKQGNLSSFYGKESESMKALFEQQIYRGGTL